VEYTDKLPLVSIIIPTYNEGKRLSFCLESICNQDYPKDNIEILVIDDESTDKTVEIAKKYGAKVIANGSHSIERGKSIGLQNAKSDYILLMDADNVLSTKSWISICIRAFLDNPNLVGAEAIWFRYDRKDSLVNRYCSLFGINDPMVFYLKRRDRLMQIEAKWSVPGKVIEETDNYFLVEFGEDNLPTVGSQGFLTRKELLLKTNYKPYLFHMDSNVELVRMGHNKYAMMKLDIIHNHSETVRDFLAKLDRNIRLFHTHARVRRYKYNMNSVKLIFTVFVMISILKPLWDSVRGFIKKQDIAWFLHPVLCFWIPIMYGFITIQYKLKMRRKIKCGSV
jgi:glycosyltransferase involved in cell wall biosynthesis